jgi:hypothetical protein
MENLPKEKSFYIGFIVGFIFLTNFEIYLVREGNNYHWLMIPVFTIWNLISCYFLGLTACGKFKIF